jgi:hypothetical protein
MDTQLGNIRDNSYLKRKKNSWSSLPQRPEKISGGTKFG